MAGQSRAGASWNEGEGKGGTLRSFIEIGSAAIDQAFLKYRAEENSAASVRHGRRDQTAEPNRRPFPKYRAIDVYSRLARPGDDGPATAVSSARQPVIEVQTRAKLRSRGWPPVSIGPSFLIYRGRVGRPCRFPGQQVPECHDRGYKSGYQLCPPVSSGSSKLREIRDVASSKTRFTALSAPISNDPPTRYFRNGARYIGNRITVQWEHRTGYFRNGQTVLRERAKFPDS